MVENDALYAGSGGGRDLMIGLLPVLPVLVMVANRAVKSGQTTGRTESGHKAGRPRVGGTGRPANRAPYDRTSGQG